MVRRLGTTTAAAALAAVAVVGFQAPASAAPDFQVPFKCGVEVTAATFSGHSPANSVDFQKDGITGMAVLASAGGTVTRSENEGDTSYGRWIELDHGNGWRTRYAHLSSQAVSVGDELSAGGKIGEAGATGGVTRAHLHYEQILDGADRKVVPNGKAIPYYDHTNVTSKNNC